MLKKLLWPLALLTLCAFLFHHHFKVKPLDLSDGFLFTVDFLSAFLTVLFFAVLVCFLLAVIPLKNKNYGRRYLFFFPVSIAAISLLFLIYFAASGPHYHAMDVSQVKNCSMVKDGNFMILYLKIERKGEVQFQTNLRTGEKTEFKVKWLSDCEYQLIRDHKIMLVKIVSANENGYECYTMMRGLTSPKQKALRIKD